MAVEKTQRLGHGHKPNNPVARRIRREKALASLIERLDKNADKYSPEQIKRIEHEIANLKDILSGDRWMRMRENKISNPTIQRKVDDKSRFDNEVIDCYDVVPRYMSKKKKKEARRSSAKDGHLNINGTVQKGWIKRFVVTFNNRTGLMALLKSGKHPNFRFDPSNPKDRKVFQTRNTLIQPFPVKKQ